MTIDPEALKEESYPLPGRVTLRGRTVTLEPLNAEVHSTALWKTFGGRDELWPWLADGPFASEHELRLATEAKQRSADMIFFAIVPTASGCAEGWTCYMRMEPMHGVVELGNLVFAPSLQRTTAATEAIFLMTSHVFDYLKYRRCEWKCNAENLPSRRAAERFGFAFEGIFRQHMIVKGRSRDTAWFSMLDSEWPVRKRAFEVWLAPENFASDGRQRQSLQQIAAAQTKSR